MPKKDNEFCPVTKVNPYKACIYRLCRDFLDGFGYDLGTKSLIFFCIIVDLKYYSIFTFKQIRVIASCIIMNLFDKSK